MGQGGGGGQHSQMQQPQQQMVNQMQMAPMGAFAGQPFAPGPGTMMGQPMGHMPMQQMQQGGGQHVPQATGNRIYVGNLAWTVEWQELKDHMRTVGKVVHADVLQDADGRSKVRGLKKIYCKEIERETKNFLP